MKSQEQELRLLIREGIRIVKKRKQRQSLEENRLREVIRHLISEVSRKTTVADKVIHKNTGINKLDAVLKRIITQIEDAYTNLSSSKKERESFRYHFLINFKNLLAPVDANRSAPGTAPQALAEQDFKVEVETDDIDAAPDASKFLPSRPQDVEAAKAEEEAESGFEKLDSDDPYVRQGAEAAETAMSEVENQIVSAYESLIAPEDAAAFKDWGLTNLKLYFDKFEGEMADQIGQEPESPDYPAEDTTTDTLNEVIYEI
jgi:flagellar hook-basal body complex protein FliE